MTEPFWKCSDEKLRKSNLFKFEDFLKKKYGINYNNNYEKLWLWSVENSGEFWKSIWEFSNVKGQLGNKLIHFSEIFYRCYKTIFQRAAGKKNHSFMRV